MIRNFLASLHELPLMLAYIEEQAMLFGFKELQLARILLAAEEALVNVICYAYPSESGTIEIECKRHHPSGFKLVIRDHGIPFNPLTSPSIARFDHGAAIEKRNIGGMGILIVLRVMDEVSYCSENNQNVLTLIKLLTPTE